MGRTIIIGEVRAVNNIYIRIAEAEKMGFTRYLAPSSNLKRITSKKKMKLIGIKAISHAAEVLF